MSRKSKPKAKRKRAAMPADVAEALIARFEQLEHRVMELEIVNRSLRQALK